MTIIEFRATNHIKAFVLNALASALIMVSALFIKGRYDTYSSWNKDKDKDTEDIKQETNTTSLLYTFLFTFVASIASYALLYYTFGFGSSMLDPVN